MGLHTATCLDVHQQRTEPTAGMKVSTRRSRVLCALKIPSNHSLTGVGFR